MGSQFNGGDEESLVEPLNYSSSQQLSRLTNTTSQLALVGVNVCPIESLDYEIIENDFFKQDWRSRGRMQIYQYICMKWALCFLIGLSVSLVGFFNNLAVENIAGKKFVITSNMMLYNRFRIKHFLHLLIDLIKVSISG
ncbi:unnamed protein product [Amaranthus hypochondriacus]